MFFFSIYNIYQINIRILKISSTTAMTLIDIEGAP